MTYEVNTLSELLERLNEERYLDRSDIRPSLLSAQVWHAIVSFPGCLGVSHAVGRSREVALSSVEYWIDEDREYSPRYIRGQLRRFGICYLRDGRVITLNKHSVSECV